MSLWPYPWDKVTDPLTIPPGAKRHQVQVQAQSATQDDFGQQLTTWSSVHTCLAAIITSTVKEQFQDGFVSQVVHRVSIDFPGQSIPVTAAMRVVRGTSVYLVQGVENVQMRDRVMHLTCIEIDSAKVGS